MTASQELERGRLAADVLENAVYIDAMTKIQTEIVTRWQSEKDEAQREWLWSMMQASKRLESLLKETMGTGQLRQKSLELERSRAEKIGAALRRVLPR